MIDVKYTGTAVALKNCIIPISAEYACDGYVYSSAIMDIMNTIPDFDSFLEYVGSRACLSASKLKLSALRWAFFVYVRQETMRTLEYYFSGKLL